MSIKDKLKFKYEKHSTAFYKIELAKNRYSF